MNTNKQATHDSRSRTALETLCWLIEDAFIGGVGGSLMGNLVNLRAADWTALPVGGNRSIADILEHVGWCKWMYEDYAFGSASLDGDKPPIIPAGAICARPHDELVAWLKEGHYKWLSSVHALPDDSELERDRLTNWGEWMKTHTIIRIMIGHDYYHAGEINHLRALLQGNDRWEYE